MSLLLAATLAASAWVQHGPRPSFTVEGSLLKTSGRGHTGNWIHTAREYEDFRLKFEYKLAQWAEAAVVMRAPRSDRPQMAGLTLVLAHDFHKHSSEYVTGALMGVRPPAKWLGEDWGHWHSVAIEVRGTRFRAEVDGTVVQELDLDAVPELRHRLKKGVIGFTDMGHAFEARNVEIEDLGAPTRFVELLKNEALEGWTLASAGNWRVHGSTVEGMNGHGIYYAPGAYGNFEFTAVVRSHARANAGIFFRGQPGGKTRGFEVQIYSPVDAVYPTGSIYGISRSRVSADFEERWFLMQVRVEGSRCRVWLDGELVAETSELPESVAAPGRIGLQIHSDDARVEWRDLRVRPL